MGRGLPGLVWFRSSCYIYTEVTQYMKQSSQCFQFLVCHIYFILFFKTFASTNRFLKKKMYFKKQIQLLVKTNKLLPQYDTQDSIDVSSDISNSDKKMNHSSINKTVLLLPPRLIVSRGSSLGSANSSFDSPTSNHAG